MSDEYLSRLYRAALEKQLMPTDQTKTTSEFMILCRRLVRDNPNADFETHLVTANNLLKKIINQSNYRR